MTLHRTTPRILRKTLHPRYDQHTGLGMMLLVVRVNQFITYEALSMAAAVALPMVWAYPIDRITHSFFWCILGYNRY